MLPHYNAPGTRNWLSPEMIELNNLERLQNLRKKKLKRLGIHDVNRSSKHKRNE